MIVPKRPLCNRIQLALKLQTEGIGDSAVNEENAVLKGGLERGENRRGRTFDGGNVEGDGASFLEKAEEGNVDGDGRGSLMGRLELVAIHDLWAKEKF